MTIPSVYGLSLKLNLDRYVHKILHEMAQFMYFVVLFFSFVKILKKIPKLPVGKSESITCTVIQMKEH